MYAGLNVLVACPLACTTLPATSGAKRRLPTITSKSISSVFSCCTIGKNVSSRKLEGRGRPATMPVRVCVVNRLMSDLQYRNQDDALAAQRLLNTVVTGTQAISCGCWSAGLSSSGC